MGGAGQNDESEYRQGDESKRRSQFGLVNRREWPEKSPPDGVHRPIGLVELLRIVDFVPFPL
ncbi:MAG TPA: hypothetical protein VF720_02805, partial [Candidatus Eisenbacteria bacterium]